MMMSFTETHNRANGNRSIEESLKDFEKLVPLIHDAGINPVGGMACTFGCPFEGKVSIPQIERVVKRYLAMRVRNITLSDTIGSANPRMVYEFASHLKDRYPDVDWAMHFHNTRDLALANIFAAMHAGMAEFDAAVGGLGGCPYAPNASGNIATDGLVNMMNELGAETGVDLEAVSQVAGMLKEIIPHPLYSSLIKAGRPWRLLPAPAQQVKVG